MSTLLRQVFAASLRHRPVASLLSLIAIMLGVGLGFSVHQIHRAALDEFDRGFLVTRGEAELQVVGAGSGFDDPLFDRVLALPAVRAASPVVALTVPMSADSNGRDAPVVIPVVGVDVLRLAALQPALMPRLDDDGQSDEENDDRRLLTLRDDVIFLSAAAREALGLPAGSAASVWLHAPGDRRLMTVRGALPGAAPGQRLAVIDIAAAQQHFGQLGRLSRIDLRLDPEATLSEARAALAGILPAGVVVRSPEVARDEAVGVSRAYRVNLTMLALMALVAGAMLVFSAQWMSVVRRLSLFATLRALGLSRRMLLGGIVFEGAVLGALGGAAGVALGHGLTLIGLRALSGDLGAGLLSVQHAALPFSPGLMLLFLAAGVLVGVIGSLLPALVASRQPPAQALKAGAALPLRVGLARPERVAVLCSGAALLLSLLPPLAGVPLGGYLAIALLLVVAIVVLAPLGVRLARRAAGGALLLRLAGLRLVRVPAQATVAAAGVAVSVALCVAMSIMVGSFRQSVDAWLGQVLPAPLYAQAGLSGTGATFSAADQQQLAAVPGVARIAPIRHESLRLPGSNGEAVSLLARPVTSESDLPLVERLDGGMAGARVAGRIPVWVSEAMVDRFGLRPGDPLLLPLGVPPPRVDHPAPETMAVPARVVGVWRDYVRQRGAVLMDLGDYRRLSGDLSANDVALHLTDDDRAAEVRDAVLASFSATGVRVASAGEIRRLSLEIFDRTFLVTYFMQAVAVLIGLFGVATTFAAMAHARRHEFGMLRHLGMTRAQIVRVLGIEGMLATAGGILSGTLAGVAIAGVLIEVVNRQSFHWSMDAAVPWLPLSLFLLVLLLLAGASAGFATWRGCQSDALRAVREDW